MKPRITVLGVGNLLKFDEGIGVHTANYLMAHYIFSDNVSIVEGGTLGMRLLNIIIGCDKLIVLDTLLSRAEPGTVTRLSQAQWEHRQTCKTSMHDVSFAETLCLAQTVHSLPETVVIGMEPDDMSRFSVGLSDPVQGSFIRLIQVTCKEIIDSGGEILSQPFPEATIDLSFWAESDSV